MSGPLAGRVAVVTGTAHGIGSAIAEMLGGEGADVHGIDRDTVDVTDPAAVGGFFAGLGAVDILVNNAGGVCGQVHHPIEEISDEDWRAVVDANLTSTFLCTRAVAAGMKERGWGRIVNISSGAGRSVSLTGIQAYASAKAGQIGFTRQTAHELGRWGITVNCIAPGFVLSNPTTIDQWESYGDEGQRTLVDSIAVRRLGQPEDIANGVRFFTSEASSWVSGQTISIDGGHALFDRTDEEFVAELATYVAIPSISRDAAPETMHAAAEWLASRLAFADARVVETDGHPLVRGEWMGAPDAPTVLVYGHYDVQPTGDPAEWRTDPFDLVVDGDVMRGRGSTDDKGPVYVVLETCRTFLAQEGALPLNVKFLFEGEEEIGSPHLPAYVEAHADELGADLVISADGAMWRASEPSLSLASKGLVSLDIEVTGAVGDLHSGRYGGTVANPIHALTAIVAALHRADGAVAVPGFTDGIPALSAERRAELGRVAWDDAEYVDTLGLPGLHGEPGYTTVERLWERPTLEVNGIEAGGKYTVIPHRAVAHVSCRLVPGQDPDDVLAAVEAHVLAQPAPGVRVRVVTDEARIPAYTIPADHPAIRAATAALSSVYPDEEVLLACIAGTLPATALFERVLGAKTLFFSFSTADEKLHAPNEYMRIRRLREGMRAWELLWRLLAAGEHRLAPVARSDA